MLSRNEQVSYNCPDMENKDVLEEGQAVKIDMGAHIDGYIAYQAVTIVCQKKAATIKSPKQADVIKACVVAQEVAGRVLRRVRRQRMCRTRLQK